MPSSTQSAFVRLLHEAVPAMELIYWFGHPVEIDEEGKSLRYFSCSLWFWEI